MRGPDKIRNSMLVPTTNLFIFIVSCDILPNGASVQRVRSYHSTA